MKKIIVLFLLLSSFAFSQDILMQNGTFTQCSGTFYDTGGVAANYSNGESFVLTICPDATDNIVQLNFTAFSTQANLDTMTIYDGNSTAAPSLGTFSGGGAANSPGLVEATTANPTGCLTIEFISDGSGNTSGWAATISCFLPCQDITAVIDSTVPALNGAGNVEAAVNETITFNGNGVFSNSGAGATYAWDFGDTNTGTGQTTTHTYTAAGIYNVTLVITDTNPNGCQSTNNINLQAIVGASSPGNPNVDAGPDLSVDCATGCVDLNASFLDIGETDVYNTSQIVFIPPFPFNGLTNSVNTNVDDRWSGVENLPFDFCFYTNTETQFQVGSNGVIRFDVDGTDTSNGYALGQNDNLPNNANPTLGEANIFTPCHDINPAVNSTNEIRWEIIGTAPNRVLAVSYFEVPLFSCTTLEATHMAVLYETTNVIDIYIRDKPACTTFNGGRAVVGIQNDAGTQAEVPPGRNVSDSPWTTTEEAWRFTPAGNSVVTFEWVDSSGVVISTDPTFNVCPTTTTTYTARVTYNNCNGDITVVEDDVTVSVPISVDLGPDQNLCIGDADVVLDATITSGTATYQWTLDGTDITGETNPTYTVSSPDSGTYSVTVVDQGCTVVEDVVITFSDSNATFTMTATCDGSTVDNVVVPGGTFSFNPVPTDGAVIDSGTGTVTGGIPGTTYSIAYTTDNTSCPDTFTLNVTVLDTDDATFTMTSTCDGGTATVTGTAGGVFVFNPVPADGAIVDPATGTVTGGTSGTTYTVEYTTNGACPATLAQDVTVFPLENADFTTTATCDGGTVTITGDTGGTFTLNPVPTDGAVIDPISGTVTSGTSLTLYTIEYTTGGPCPAVTTQDVIVLLNDDASFSIASETCDGGTVTINGTTGGTFTFNPVPADAATIDPNTGEVTNGTSGTSYIIEYTTNGSCPASSTETLNVLPADDASYTMTPNCFGATAIVTGLTGGTFALNPVPADGAIIDSVTGEITMGVPGTTYTVEYITNGACVAIGTQDVTVFTQPVIPAIPTYEICDNDDDGDETNGLAEFNLATIDAAAINGQADVVVSYYSTLADAQATPPTNEIGPLYSNVTPVNETIYIRLENTVTGCVSTIEPLGLMVNPLPVPTAPTPLELCDDDTDGMVEFDLTVKDAEIINGQANMSVIYYETQVDADAGTNPIGPLYTNVLSANSQIIIASLQNDATGCTDTVELTLIVYALPVIPTITDYELCDYNNTGDEQESFDLTTKDAEIANGQLDVVVTYHISAADAASGANPLPNIYVNINSNPETIYVRVENTTTSCVGTSDFDLIVNPVPVAIAPTPLEVCDDNVPDGITQIDLTIKNAEISGGNPDYQVTYYETLLDAENEVNPIGPMYTNTTNGQVIFVRVEDVNTGCFDTTTLTLQVEQAPIACTPTPLEYCDPDSDGFGEFDLTLADNEVACGITAGLVITYHETMADAENNINAITGIYNNIVVNMQTIYVRIESSTIATDCASFVELQLIVNPTPQITDPSPLEVCDNDADGFATFDLTDKEDEILNLLDADATNDLDPTQYIVSYYISEANAIAGTNPIATPNAFVNTIIDTQTIWIRVTDNTNTCATVRPLVLIVNPLPVLVQPAPLELCDVNNPGDEVEEFNLEDANAQILNGQTGITLSYYLTQGDADLGVNPLPTLYTNIVNAQTIYVRAAINTTGCYDTITLDLRVNPIPSPIAMPVVYQECDDDNDGFAAFDLDSQSATIINGEPGITVQYFETMEDAQSMTNPLVSPYNNIVASMQIIYVVVTNTGTMTTPATGCFTIVELPLEVLPAPVVDLEADLITDGYVICDTDGDGFAQFDFDTVITPDVYDAQDPADFVLTYHVTQADADTGNNPITNTSNYTNVSNPQTIYIRLESLINGCVTTTQSFQIIVSLPPVINPAYDNELSQCDDLDANYYEANDGVTAFDLTVEDAEIVNGNTSWVVVYYETMVDAQAGTNPIVDPTNYTNIATPQTVYVSVTDADTSCSSYTTVTIRVLPNPSPSPNPVDLELCDDNDVLGTGPNDLAEIFDLTQNETFIINGEVGVSASYYTNQADAITGTNAIVDPTMHINEDPDNPGVALTPQTIYVRLTNGDDTTGLNGTGCFTLVNFDVIVNPLPVVTPVDDYTHCEFNTDGVYESFDFTTMTDAILNGQDPTVFTVTYHETQAEADTSMNDLIPSGLYTNTSNPQTIYVNITNTVTGCFTTALTFDLQVHEDAHANEDMVPIVYTLCDDNMEFDGDPTNDSVAFDLVTLNPEVLDNQDPASYIVSYYLTQADADAGINPLPVPYNNVTNPQVLYTRVDNNTMVDDGMGNMVDSSDCYATAEVTLEVNPMPAFDLDDNYLLCINTNGTEVINTPAVDTGLSLADGYTFVWFLEGVEQPQYANMPSITPTEGGNYSVVVTSALGCSTTVGDPNTETFVEVSEPPVVTAEITTLAFADQHDIQVTATTTASNAISVYEFSIDGGSWEANTPNDGLYTFSNVEAGEHTITVRDTIGCGETTITITVIDYPQYFTPNGDGYHDTWNILGLAGQPDAIIYIFDRYGKLLKQISPSGAGWNGLYNGNPMANSSYWFTVQYREPTTNEVKTLKAHFALKR